MEYILQALRGWGVVLGVPALFVSAYIYPLIPTLKRIPICAVKGFLGCDCPGCGLIRSFAALTHGKIRQSIDFHPLGIIIAGWLIYVFARSLVKIIMKRDIPMLLNQGQRDVLLYAFLAALIIQWLFKILIA